MRESRKIIIADHHPLGAAAVSAAALKVDEKLEVQSVESLGALVEAVGTDDYALAVFSCSLCEGRGAQALANLRARIPGLPLLALDGDAGVEDVQRLRAHGINGILAAPASLEELARVISILVAGGEWFPVPSKINGRRRQQSVLERLSPAQKRVLAELAQGKPNRAIAESLCLSEATIKSHLYAIYKELGVKNRTQALLKIQ